MASASAAHAARSSSTYGDGLAARRSAADCAGRRTCWRLLHRRARGACPPGPVTAAARLAAMCGIVGLRRSTKQAQDVVIEGLRRLEYRGYDSAGRRPGRRRAIARRDKRAGKLANLEKALAEHPLPAVHDRHRAHPLGHPRRAHRRQRPPAPRPRPAGWRWSTTGSSRTSPTLRAELEADGARAALRDRHRGRRPPARARGARRGADLTAAMQGVCRRLEGAFTLVAVDAAGPRPRGRRPPQLARWSSASARARTSSAPTSRRSSSTPARRWSSARTRSSRSPATGVEVTGFDGSPAEGKPLPRRLGPVGRREGRPRLVHAQGDLRAAARGRRHAARVAATPPGCCSSTRCGSPTQELRDVDKIIIIACGTAFYAGMVAKYAIEHWTRIPSRSSWPTSSATATRSSTQRTLVVAISQSGETADTLMAIRHARAQRSEGAGDLQHQRLDDPARVRRGASTPTPAPRSASPRPRASSTQLVACYLLGLYLAQVRGTTLRRRDRARCWTSSTRCPATSRPCSTRRTQVYELAREHRRHPVGAVPRPPRRLPGGPRGRAQAQGARLHPRRGLRRRRAQARADRADRGRACRSSCVVPPRGPRPAARQDDQRHPGDPRPRRPHHRAWPRRATTTSRPTPTW